MKYFTRYLLLYTLLQLAGTAQIRAQSTLWNTFNQVSIHRNGARDINVMYYDSITDKSYIGGYFIKVNGDTVNIITFDGTDFDLLPNAPTSFIQDIVRYHDKLYVGGDYGLASWDGNNWTSYTTNLNRPGVKNLRVINDKLYVTGTFTEIAGHAIGGVAIWNDTTWSAFPGLDTVWTGSAAIADLEYYKGEFYLASQFQRADRPERNGLIRFNGQHWYNVADFVTDGMGFVKELMIWNDTLYVAGYFDEASGSKGNGIAKWDGQQWHRLQQGVQVYNERGAVTEMAVHNNKLYISGAYSAVNGWHKDMNGRFACWDGNQWCDMGSSFQPGENVFGTWQQHFFVAGGFDEVAGMPTSSIAEWIGGNQADTCIYRPVSVNNKNREPVNISIYPIPATNSITLEAGQAMDADLHYTIYDIQGKRLTPAQYTFKVVPGKIIIDIQQLADGIYCIQVDSKEGSGSKVFIKQTIK